MPCRGIFSVVQLTITASSRSTAVLGRAVVTSPAPAADSSRAAMLRGTSCRMCSRLLQFKVRTPVVAYFITCNPFLQRSSSRTASAFGSRRTEHWRLKKQPPSRTAITPASCNAAASLTSGAAQGSTSSFKVSAKELLGVQKMRLDTYLSTRLEDASRAKIQSSIKEGLITVNGSLQLKASYVLKGGDMIQCTLLPPAPQVRCGNCRRRSPTRLHIHGFIVCEMRDFPFLILPLAAKRENLLRGHQSLDA